MPQGTTVIDHMIPRTDVVYRFAPDMEPVLTVDPGTVVLFQTDDCFGGQIQTESDRVTDINMEYANPATGPVAVRGAEPGDSLIVDILDVRPGSRGFTTIFPGVGQLAEWSDAPRTKVIPIEDGVAIFRDDIRLPLRPMVGVIGVAPALDPVATLHPGEHGGNLDEGFHGAGTRIYFPVRQRGALFAVGDMHASMGDGEICGTGIEVAGEVVLRFHLLKGKQTKYPVSVTRESWITHGVGETYTAALLEACREAARLLTEESDLTMDEAFMLLSVCGDAGVCQSCQPCPVFSTARMAIPRLETIPISLA